MAADSSDIDFTRAEAVGEKICPSCYNLIQEKAPEETANYRRLTLMDRILGVPCFACSPAAKTSR